MVAVRLEDQIENRLDYFAKRQSMTKSAVIKEALMQYFDSLEQQKSPYELGKKLFGQVGSGDGTLSKTYKSKLKDKIRAKNSHR